MIPFSQAQQPAQAGTESSDDAKHEDQGLTLHCEEQHESPAPWEPAALGQV